MMSSNTLKDLLQQAATFQIKGDNQSARLFYQKLLEEEAKAGLDHAFLQAVLFFNSIQEYKEVITLSRLYIQSGGLLNRIALDYVTACIKNAEATNTDAFQDLKWILSQSGQGTILGERLLIAQCFFETSHAEEAYFIFVSLIEIFEKKMLDSPNVTFEHYVKTLLYLVDYEYHFGTCPQARFHVRRLIGLEGSWIINHQLIARWSLLLDETALLVSRNDWGEFATHLVGEVSKLCGMYREFYEGYVNREAIHMLLNTSFRDTELDKKRGTYVCLLSRAFEDLGWLDWIEVQYRKLPDDMLTSLLYGEMLTIRNPQNVRGFWKEHFLRHADKPEVIRAYSATSKKSNTVQNKEINVMFLGGGEKIGGTSILVSIGGKHILLDGGMHLQGEDRFPDFSLLIRAGITVHDLDALLITHAHLDHTGAVPYLHSLYPELPMFATEETKQLMKVLLDDVIRYSESTDEMYDLKQLQMTLTSISSIDFFSTFEVPSKQGQWKVTYYPAGHILGAAAIHLVTDGISVLFTGDYSVENQRTVNGIQLPEDLHVDVLITESTYGFLPTNASIRREQQEKLLVQTILQTVERGGPILIPAFAVGRAQEIIQIVKGHFTAYEFLPFPLYLDGKVAEVCRIYEKSVSSGQTSNKPYYGQGVQSANEIYSDRQGSNYPFTKFFEEYILSGGSCIIASSGMLTDGSASSRYAEKIVGLERACVAFTGYLDEESPGARLFQNTAEGSSAFIQLNGKYNEIRASVSSYRLSAHASREEISQLILQLQPKAVFLMHGEHQKHYRASRSWLEGNVIYPSIIDILSSIEHIQVYPAFNGKNYHILIS